MTRYARAQGSKASNQRMPNDATPWYVMKQQLEENKSKNQEVPQKTKSAKELLQEKEDLFYYDTAGNTQNNWAEFEDARPQHIQNKKNKNTDTNADGEQKHSKKVKKLQEDKNASTKQPANSKYHKLAHESSEKLPSKRKMNEVDDACETEQKAKKQKKEKADHKEMSNAKPNTAKGKKKRYFVLEPNETEHNNINSEKDQSQKDGEGKDQKMAKKLKNNSNAHEQENHENTVVKSPSKKESTVKEHKDESKNEMHQKLSKRQKRNMRKKHKDTNEHDVENSKTFTSNDAENEEEGSKPVGQRFENHFPNKPNRFNTFDKGMPRANSKNHHMRPPKIRDDMEHKRRKPDNGPVKMMLNGVEVEIVKYDGFPVKKEDAERLKDLKKQMIMKGIPKKEIDAALKLERRRAEKALARMRRDVCYHCRKAGHMLSDCPELGSEQTGTGICFKCGSTEHTHFECKVARATEYRFAKCFICREQGHIAKQCPDNPKGVYPQGGACKICGDVTHLKKDCPDLIKEKEETSITVDTIANSTLESLDNETKKTGESERKSVKSKVVKF